MRFWGSSNHRGHPTFVLQIRSSFRGLIVRTVADLVPALDTDTAVVPSSFRGTLLPQTSSFTVPVTSITRLNSVQKQRLKSVSRTDALPTSQVTQTRALYHRTRPIPTPLLCGFTRSSAIPLAVTSSKWKPHPLGRRLDGEGQNSLTSDCPKSTLVVLSWSNNRHNFRLVVMSGTQSQGSNSEGPGQDRHHQGDSSRGPHGLHGGLQLQPRAEHSSSSDPKANPTSPPASHEGDVRHRLEAVAQRALSPSDSVTPEATAPASTTARADGSHATPAEAAAAPPRTTSSPGLAPPADSSFPEPSPFSLDVPSSSQEQSGIWRSLNPFETQPPPRSTSPSPHLPSSVSPHHLAGQQRSAEADHLQTIEDTATRADRPSIPFEGHIREALPPQHLQHHHLTNTRPFAEAIMAFEKVRKFSTGTSVHRRRKMSTLVEKEGSFGPALTVCSCLFPRFPRRWRQSPELFVDLNRPCTSASPLCSPTTTQLLLLLPSMTLST